MAKYLLLFREVSSLMHQSSQFLRSLVRADKSFLQLGTHVRNLIVVHPTMTMFSWMGLVTLYIWYDMLVWEWCHLQVQENGAGLIQVWLIHDWKFYPVGWMFYPYCNQVSKVSDTTTAQASRGKDIQGIPWDRLQFTREKYRETRLQQYKNYENLLQSHDDLEKVCIIHNASSADLGSIHVYWLLVGCS